MNWWLRTSWSSVVCPPCHYLCSRQMKNRSKNKKTTRSERRKFRRKGDFQGDSRNSERKEIDHKVRPKAHTFYVSYPLRRPPPAAATTATATALNQHQPSAISPDLFFIINTTTSIYPHTSVDELPRPSRPTNMASRRCRQSNRGPIGHNHCTNIEGKAQADLSSECRYWRLCRDC